MVSYKSKTNVRDREADSARNKPYCRPSINFSLQDTGG